VTVVGKLYNDYGYGKASRLIHFVDLEKAQKRVALCDKDNIYPYLRIQSDTVALNCPDCLKMRPL
jgi:hypothetical protein